MKIKKIKIKKKKEPTESEVFNANQESKDNTSKYSREQLHPKKKISKKKRNRTIAVVILVLIVGIATVNNISHRIEEKREYEKQHQQGQLIDIKADKIQYDEDGNEITLPDDLKVCVLNSNGNGETILIDNGFTEILIDGSDVYSKEMLKTLKSHVNGPIEYVINTKCEPGRVTGLCEIYKNYQVEKTLYPEALDEQSPNYNLYKKLKKEVKKNNSEFILTDNVNIEAGKNAAINVQKITDVNKKNSSLVCLLTSKSFNMLILGGINEINEKALMDKINDDYSIVTLSSFGSEKAVNKDFISKVDPDYVVISTYKKKKISKETLEELEGYRTNILRTDKNKTITFGKKDGEFTIDYTEEKEKEK